MVYLDKLLQGRLATCVAVHSAATLTVALLAVNGTASGCVALRGTGFTGRNQTEGRVMSG